MACPHFGESETTMNYTSDHYGTVDGIPVSRHRVSTDSFSFSCIDYGCTITEIAVPDQLGNIENVVLALDSLEEYVCHDYYLGCVVGRVAGRIQNGQFTLDDQTVHLPLNDGPNHLHGDHFHKVVWNPSIEQTDDGVTIRFERSFPHGHHGYPGNIDVSVEYTITPHAVAIRYEAKTDAPTVMNMTNHTYFNLSGTSMPISDHTLQLMSDSFYELDETLIPRRVKSVMTSRAFDFREAKRIEDGLNDTDAQLDLAGGFDHPFCLSQTERPQIELRHASGRRLSVHTTEPCVVFYSGNMLPNGLRRTGLCVETQQAPNLLDPRSVLRPGETYVAETTWTFAP